jgi:hypothetical protein
MLREKIGEVRGKVTGQRVLPSDGNPKMETAFEVSGMLYGVELTMMGTYWSTVREDGTLYGECPQQGIIVTKGGELGTWTAAGVGKFTGEGSAVSFRGAIYFQTVPQSLARLRTVAALYEWDIDAEGNAQAPFWEWI